MAIFSPALFLRMSSVIRTGESCIWFTGYTADLPPSVQELQLDVPEGNLVTLGFQTNISLAQHAPVHLAHLAAVDGKRQFVALGADLVKIPFPRRLHAVLFHLL